MGTSGGTSTKSTSSSPVESTTSTFFHLRLLQLPLQSGLHYLPSPSTLLQWIFTSQVELCGLDFLSQSGSTLFLSMWISASPVYLLLPQCGSTHLRWNSMQLTFIPLPLLYVDKTDQ